MRSHADRLGIAGGLVREPRRASCTSLQAQFRRTARRPGHDGDRDRIARARAPRVERGRHDGRDHAHGPGAGDRRRAREGARRAAGRPEARDPAERNESDLADLPGETRRDLEFILVDSIEQVFDVAFGSAETSAVRRPRAVGRQAAARSH